MTRKRGGVKAFLRSWCEEGAGGGACSDFENGI